MDQHAQRQGLMYIGVSIIGYALLPVIVRLLQTAGMHSLDIVTWRFIFAAPALWLLLAALRRPAPAHRLPRPGLLALGVLLALGAVSAFFGLERLPAGTYVLLFYSYPAMVAVISALLGERLSRRAWAALGLALVGVILTIPDFGAGLRDGAEVGVLLALFNALVIAVYFILTSHLLRGRASPAYASAWLISGALATVLVLALVRPVNAAPDATSWLYLLALALACTVLPVFTLAAGIQRLGASKAAIASTFEPVVTITLAALILGESLRPGQFVGGALILASIVLLQRPARRRKAAAAAEIPPAGA